MSSARVVRCWVKSRNERNPFPYLPALWVGTLRILPVTNWRKAGTTSSHHGPYGQGYTRTTMGRTEGCKPARASQSQKPSLSPDRSLQLDSVKSESLVIAGQQHCGECVPEPCTHRPSSHGSREWPKWPQHSGPYARLGDWD